LPIRKLPAATAEITGDFHLFPASNDIPALSHVFIKILEFSYLGYFRFLRCSPFDEYKLWKRQVDTGKGELIK